MDIIKTLQQTNLKPETYLTLTENGMPISSLSYVQHKDSFVGLSGPQTLNINHIKSSIYLFICLSIYILLF